MNINLSCELRKIADLLRLGPRPDRSFNSTIGRNGHCYMYFNEVGNRLQPEQVHKNIDFFGALNIIGVYPVGARLRSYFNPHCRNFQALHGVQMTSARAPIVGFKVPEMGYSEFHQSLLKNTMVLDGNNVQGDKNHLLLRVREQLKGEELVCFGVEYANGTQYYMWDEDHIYPVETDAPGLFVRSDKYGLMLVTDAPETYKIKDLAFGRVEWSNLYEDVVVNDNKIVVDVDMVKYEIPPETELVLEVADGIARDSCQDAIFSGYFVTDGTYNIGARTGEVKNEPVKRKVDSPQAITLARNCFVDKSHLRSNVVIAQKKRKYNAPFMNFRADANYAISRNSLTVRVPFLCEQSKGRSSKGDLVKDYMQMKAMSGGGIVRPVSGEFEAFLAKSYLFIKRGHSYVLQYRPKVVFNEFGLSNCALPGYHLVVYENIPISNRSMFAYRDYYMLFYDPEVWKYGGEDNIEDFLDLNNAMIK